MEGEVLVYADRDKPGDAPVDRLIIGEAHPHTAADAVQNDLQQVGLTIERYVPIMAWHGSHIVLVLPLPAALYHHDQNLDAVVQDRALLKQAMRVTARGLVAIQLQLDRT